MFGEFSHRTGAGVGGSLALEASSTVVWTFIAMLAAAAALAPPSAFAQTCAGDVTGLNLTCNTNDASITQVSVLSIIDGCTGAGDTATVVLQFTIVGTSQTRNDIGLFVATDGGDAITGQCAHFFLTPISLTPVPGSGTGPYLDANNNACGDIAQGVMNVFNTPQIVLDCVDVDMNGQLDFSTLVSWNNNANQVCTGVADAVPPNPAQCTDQTFTGIPVPVPTATATSTRTATATQTGTRTNTPTNTGTVTNTPTNTPANTATVTNTPTNTATNTATVTNTPTNTATHTATPTDTPANTPTNTATATNTATNTATITATSTNTATNTATITATATNTPTNTATITATPTNTPANTATNTSTVTNTPTNTPSNTRTATSTATNTSTATRTASNTPTRTATGTATRTPTNTPAGEPGQPCTTPAQCSTMICVDGVCCTTPCDGPNETCNLPGREGTCVPETTAPAPALSGAGKLAALGVLLTIAALGLRRRRHN